jgi:hypothetical protein
MHLVLEDVKSVQREINSIQGKVERTFTVTDVIIFRVSITTKIEKQAYQLAAKG